MKKFLLSLFVVMCLVFGVQVADALDYSKISTNAKIVAALGALDSINRRDVIAILYGKNATHKPIRVLFRDLAMMGAGDCEAMTVPTKNDGLIIYINAQHKGASPELIACLIAHESQHHTFTNTKQEELKAWISETQAWNEFAKRNRALAQSSEPLAKRERYIARVNQKSGVQGVRNIIATNPVYAGLN